MTTSDMASPGKQGLLLVGHGSRDARGQAGFLRTAEMVADRLPDWEVEPCFLELTEPTIRQGMQTLADRQVRRLTAMPLLLLAAGHVKRDIPAAVASAAAEVVAMEPIVLERIAGHLGCHPAILELAQQRCQAAIDRDSAAGKAVAGEEEETLLLIVGRGASDPLTLAEMKGFVDLRAAASRLSTKVCYLSLATPCLEEAIEQIAASSYRRVIVQPHLLFPGALSDRLERTIEQAAKQFSRQSWAIADVLGADPLLADAVVGRVSELPKPRQSFADEQLPEK